MPDARLTHTTRATLPFRQRQQDDDETTAQANITKQVGVDSDPLVHTETRERSQPVRGLATGSRQDLADYADKLEAHVGEFQGDGYTYEDDLLNTSVQCILERIKWSLKPGRTDSLQYEADLQIGRGTMEAQPIRRRNPTYNASMTPMLRVDGIDLPGMRSYELERTVGAEVNAVFDRSTAENNDIVVNEGESTQITFEGTLTGPLSSRESTDNQLRALAPTSDPVTLETKFPGYSLDGYVLEYVSRQRGNMGEQRHDYRIVFVEGIKA
ncbi:hypothetical protein OSG_eHP18_00090 [environmental Halophage eHP-18]|nr:hypothetical protein OSG_eHP18_00090 [environmental Halophage eHP-18]